MKLRQILPKIPRISQKVSDLDEEKKSKTKSDKSKLFYLDAISIIDLNKYILELSKKQGVGHKGDKHEVKDYNKLKQIVNSSILKEGDLYDKATEVLISIIQNHAFYSANRRTAYISAYAFLKFNGKISGLSKYNPHNSKIMIGIREKGYYTFEEVKNWLITGEIRDYVR